MDNVTNAALVAATTGVVLAWFALHRAARAEARVAQLSHELQTERHAASHDALTGLPNRRAFYRLGAAMLAEPADRALPRGLCLLAVVLDLDNFKQINDRFGHAAGDEVLIAVAQRFSGYAKGRLVSRLGGDEFAGLITGPADDGDWLRFATRRLTDLIAAPMQINGHLVTVTGSVGLAPVPAGSALAEALRRADAAMYQAKGRNRTDDLARSAGCPAQARTPALEPLPQTFTEGIDAHQLAGPCTTRRPPASSTTTRQLVDTTRRTDTGGP